MLLFIIAVLLPPQFFIGIVCHQSTNQVGKIETEEVEEYQHCRSALIKYGSGSLLFIQRIKEMSEKAQYFIISY
jgi:hypothetical protein